MVCEQPRTICWWHASNLNYEENGDRVVTTPTANVLAKGSSCKKAVKREGRRAMHEDLFRASRGPPVPAAAFIKRLRAFSESTADSLLKDLQFLNLTKYVSEAVQVRFPTARALVSGGHAGCPHSCRESCSIHSSFRHAFCSMFCRCWCLCLINYCGLPVPPTKGRGTGQRSKLKV